VPDSDLMPDYIQFIDQRQKKAVEKTKSQPELVPDSN
jgi:hypothetical protein